MNVDKLRWKILIANCLTAFCLGAILAFSAFTSPMVDHLNTNYAQNVTSLALGYTLLNTFAPLFNIVGGTVSDTKGPRGIMIIAGVLLVAGYIVCGLSRTANTFIISYGFLIGSGVGINYACIIPSTVKFFPDRSGFAGGCVTSVYGLSGIIMPFVITAMLKVMSISMIFIVLGVIFFAVVFCAAMINRKCPDNIVITGYDPKKDMHLTAESHDMDFREMLKTADFYNMLLMIMCGSFAGIMLTGQSAQIAEQMMGFSREHAAMVVSLIAVFNMLGRISSGSMSDKLGAPRTLLITFTILTGAGLVLGNCGADTKALFFIGVCAVGYVYGSVMGIFPGFTSRQFGRKYNSINYSIIFIGFALGGFFGPTLMNVMYNATGAYQKGLMLDSAFGVLGIVLVVVFMIRNRKK